MAPVIRGSRTLQVRERETLSARKQQQLAWEAARPGTDLTAVDLTERVLPALGDVPLSAIQAATGLSLSAQASAPGVSRRTRGTGQPCTTSSGLTRAGLR